MRLIVWVLLVGSHFLSSSPVWAAQKPPKLNVLFIIADDLNNNLACYGHPLVQSPHLDSLARRGVRFERAYCQNPVCNPSRTSLLSGRRPGDKLRDVVFLPDHFRKHGYLTAEVGKVAHSYGVSAKAIAWEVQGKKGGVRRAIELIEQNRDRPFFVAVGLAHTHPGFSHTRDALRLYPTEKITWPQEPLESLKTIPEIAFRGINIDKALTDDQRRQHMAKYYASISTLDAEVGQLFQALDRLKLWDSTVVVFTSDHGRHLGEHGGIYDKRTLFEVSVRVPLIVAAPGKKANVASSRLVELVDLYPTLVELCGLPASVGVEGTSFAPLLLAPDREWKKAAFAVSSPKGNTGRSVRTERYRYSEWGDGRVATLYDYQTDPHEHKNLVNDPGHRETMEQMRGLLKAGWKRALPSGLDIGTTDK